MQGHQFLKNWHLVHMKETWLGPSQNLIGTLRGLVLMSLTDFHHNMRNYHLYLDMVAPYFQGLFELCLVLHPSYWILGYIIGESDKRT